MLTEILLAGLLTLVIIQIILFYKIINIIKHLNKLLFEVRILFKQSGIYYQPQKKKVIKTTSCQFCKYRISFIQISDESPNDNFYYKCRIHDTEIKLSDSCQRFEREFPL
jgi:hypothetical protein